MESQKNRDLDLALNLYEEINTLGVTENAIIPRDRYKEQYKPRTIVDQTLELIDPTPNIHTLFVQFNARFFSNVLLPVEVKWSKRMTSCAGICYYHPRNKQCVITLSVPLLVLRPRKDLVETLLHEMIHGYLFITNNNRDRDGHGPEFCKHMYRINKEAGTNITIYHNFHDEVKLYKQHWWRCNGSCQKKPPYFGNVRRAMNRAPGPSDFWWKEHQQNCGGQFIKIKEPENYKKQNSKNNKESKPVLKDTPKTSNISNWLTKINNPPEQYKSNNMPTSEIKALPKLPNAESAKTKNIPKSNHFTNNSPINAKINNGILNKNVKKLGNNTNNVHGWGVGGPKDSSTSKVSNTTPSERPKFSYSGQLGGSRTGRSNLLDKFAVKTNNKKLSSSDRINTENKISKSNQGKITTHRNDTSHKEDAKPVNCPICNEAVCINIINEHIDSCLNNKNKKRSYDTTKTLNDSDGYTRDTSPIRTKDFTSTPKQSNTIYPFPKKKLKTENLDKPKFTNCSVCLMTIKTEDLPDHLNTCSPQHSSSSSYNLDNTIIIDSSSDSDSPNSILVKPNHKKDDILETQKCLVCNMIIMSTMSLNEHLEECMETVFNDESMLFPEYDNDNSEETCATDQKYPCPVCMELFTENTMSNHLDMCLNGK